MKNMGDIMNRCPCCGQTLAVRAKPKIDLTWNTLLYGDQAVRFTASEAELLAVLLQHMPNVVSREQLITGIYGFQDGPGNESSIIDTWICHIRPRLKAIGLQIITHRGCGFSLTSIPVKRAA